MNWNILVNKKLAQNIVKHIDLLYLQAYPEALKSRGTYYENLQAYDNFFEKIVWSLGGVKQDKYGNKNEIQADEEPIMIELNSFLDRNYSDLSLSDRNNILKHCSESYCEISHRYNEITTQCTKIMSWENLIKALTEIVHKNDKNFINIKDLFDEHAKSVPLLNWDTYKTFELYQNLDDKLDSCHKAEKKLKI